MDDDHAELVDEVCRTGVAYVFGVPHHVQSVDPVGAHLVSEWTGEETYAPWKIISTQ